MHGDKYSYTLSNPTVKSQKTTITCSIHGDFQQTPYHHINRKQGCPTCGSITSGKTKQKNTDLFVEKAKAIHGDKYDYSKTCYTAAKEKVLITCKSHGDFYQLASGHLSGYGCKHCASHGKGRVDFSIPTKLYYLYLPDFNYYKLGITSQDIHNRYRTKFDLEQFQVVFIKEYTTGKEAYAVEQFLLDKYNSLRYIGKDKILKSGNTEIFTEDIFKGDYSEYITH